jgi:hypothetical protein|tara:strand:+ start:159 stop:452 length:294 start_codon:yes stop_codon:yes gene_type:complete
MDKKEIQKRLDDYQNEYMEIMGNIISNDYTDVVDNDKGFIYWWERAKRLQKNIITNTFIEREIALDEAKMALEKAFTPRIKSMLSKKIQKEIDDGEN